ncbi:MAG: imidazole glycerol phosphate synthase subunit HisH [Chthoniobacterales bacterium]|nr:imidazole glycerol phosphate synthase subunit HisH [Chthoniobacterales bacterium]MCX7712282.1 imidazole glycerol phosphate synthase subunit HisH [Chthoniobacterales bacterium]
MNSSSNPSTITLPSSPTCSPYSNTSPKIALIDYGRGNLRSVFRALQSVGANVTILSSPDQFPSFDALVLPGVGAFGDCIAGLQIRGFWNHLLNWLNDQRPYLGICLGYQILFEQSEESPGIQGLAYWKGTVRRFPSKPGVKIPHIGWNQIYLGSSSPLFTPSNQGSFVYFVHSYRPIPHDTGIITAWCEYAGERFAAAAGCGPIQAVQFHPEKSQTVGLGILKNFVEFLRSQIRK